MKMETNIVYQEDCIEGMKKIPSNSIDLVLTDPPYGITACEWDKPIDLEKFWVEIKRIIKPNGAIVMTASQPFTTDLINSNREMFKYELIWDKKNISNPLLCKKQPLKKHENILIFYNNQPIYNPQMTTGKMRDKAGKRYGKISNETQNGAFNLFANTSNVNDQYYPKSIVEISNAVQKGKLHPTQKPTSLGLS